MERIVRIDRAEELVRAFTGTQGDK
jgi:hypothetical protein